MPQTGPYTTLIDYHQYGARPVNAWDANFRRELQAKVRAEKWNALRSALVAAGRLVRRVMWLVVDFFDFPEFERATLDDFGRRFW